MQNIVKPEIFCQNCRAPNTLREPNCVKCGTRLMLVVFPDSQRFETVAAPSFYENHLLERVSSIETRLSKVLAVLEKAYDQLESTYEIIKDERLLLKCLFEAVEEINPEITARIGELLIEKEGKQKTKPPAADVKEKILQSILSKHENPNHEIFSNLVREGLTLLSQKDEKQAFQMLERAALLSPQNTSLLLFNAVECFRAEKYQDAKKYLEKITGGEAENWKIQLLSAALMIDDGQVVDAGKLLNTVEPTSENAPAIKFLLAFLAAAIDNWTICAEIFAELGVSGQSAEVFYLTGCAYFQLEKYREALKYLENAVSIDAKFSDAWLMLAFVYRRLNLPEVEKTAIEKAADGHLSGSLSARFLKKNDLPELKTALPFEHFQRKNCRLLTGGALKLTGFYQRIILKSIGEE